MDCPNGAEYFAFQMEMGVVTSGTEAAPSNKAFQFPLRNDENFYTEQ